MENVVIFGASGHGNVVLDILEKENKYNVVGFIDTFTPKGDLGNGYQVLGAEKDLPALIKKYKIVGGIIGIGDNWTRKKVSNRIKEIVPEFNFVSAVHPNATIGRKVTIGKGTVVMPGVVVNTESYVGDFCILNTNSSLDHDCVMGNFSSLAPRVTTGGIVIIGEYTAICLGACMVDGITIGEHSVIGAGALVNTDFGDNIIAYGSPAVKIRNRAKGEKYLRGATSTDNSDLISKLISKTDSRVA